MERYTLFISGKGYEIKVLSKWANYKLKSPNFFIFFLNKRNQKDNHRGSYLKSHKFLKVHKQYILFSPNNKYTHTSVFKRQLTFHTMSSYFYLNSVFQDSDRDAPSPRSRLEWFTCSTPRQDWCFELSL